MTIQSPGDAASTAAWMDWNRPCFPCQLPTVHTLGFGPFLAGAAAAAPLRPDPTRTATIAAAIIRRHDRATVRRARAEDFAVGKAIHPHLPVRPRPNTTARWHYPLKMPRCHARGDVGHWRVPRWPGGLSTTQAEAVPVADKLRLGLNLGYWVRPGDASALVLAAE